MPSDRVLLAGWSRGRVGRAMVALLAFAAGPLLAATTVEVGIAQYQFSPAEVRIAPGDSVRWTNHETRTSHSVVFPAEAGLESDRLFPDERWTRQFDQAGDYPYHCGPHPEMKGVIHVGP